MPSMASSRRAAWCIWLALALVALVSLRTLRIDNSLDDWMPQLRSVGPVASYVVIGWPGGACDRGALRAALATEPGVIFILDRSTIRPLVLAGLVTPEALVVSPDGSYEGMFCFRSTSADDERFMRDVRRHVAQVAGENASAVSIAGPAAYHAALNDYSRRRMPLIIALIVVLGAGMMRWICGSWRSSISAVGAVLVSQVVLLGIIALSGRAIDMALSMVPPLMMSLGFSYAAHRALRKGAGGALLLCGLTTAAGIASFAFTSLAPIRAFAIFGAVGLILVWCATQMLVVPPAGPIYRARWLRPGLWFILAVLERTSRRSAIAAAVMILVGGLVATRFLRFELDSVHHFPEHSQIRRDFATLNQRLTGMLPFELRSESREVQRFTQTVAGISGLRKVVNISPLFGTAGTTLWCLADNDALGTIIAAERKWREFGAHWRGVAAQLADAERVVRNNAAGAVPAMALLAGGAAWLAGRRMGMLAIGVVAALAPVAAGVLIACTLRVEFSLPSLMIGAITIGIAIDDTLHLASEQRRRRSTRRALVACYRPCVGSSLTAAACVSIFLLSPLGPVRQFGALMSAAILLGALTNQLLVPRLLTPARRAKSSMGMIEASPTDGSGTTVYS